MRNPTVLFGALGLGAGLMYLFDPDRGKRRRVLVRDKGFHLLKVTNRGIKRKAAEVRNKTQGIWFETERYFETEIVTDEQLEGRVRSRLGRLASHPHRIKTVIENGKVIISGKIPEEEIEIVLKGIQAISGVREIENKLTVNEEKGNVLLMPGSEPGKNKPVMRRENLWSSSARLAAATIGGGLAVYGVSKKNALSSVLGLAGIGLIAGSAMNKGFGASRATDTEKAIKVNKTMLINAPREKVFKILKYPQYFPYFMSHVRKVEPLGDKKFLWTVDGIAGTPVEWTIEITDIVTNESINWKNAGETKNAQYGSIRLEEVLGNSTRLHLEMNYQPTGGKFGHFVASIFSRDPRSEMNDDFLRLKAYLEKGRIPRDAAANTDRKRRKDMKVEQIMTKNPAYATTRTSLHDVAQLMAEFDCGSIPVVEADDNKKPIGIISDRDIVLRTVAHNKNPLNMIAGETMTENVVAVKPDMSLEECVLTMERNQIRRIVVVDENGLLCGIVAQADIARNAPFYETFELVKDVSVRAA